MDDFPFFIASAVLVALVSALVLMAVFGLTDRIIFFLQLAFFSSVGVALWCVFSRHWITEYAVWTMYLSGLGLAILMVRRVTQKRAMPSGPKARMSVNDAHRR